MRAAHPLWSLLLAGAAAAQTDSAELVRQIGLERDHRARNDAYRELFTRKPADAVPLLIKALDEPELPVRIGALEALAQLGPLAKDAVPAVKKATEDEDEVVREEAAATLKAIE